MTAIKHNAETGERGYRNIYAPEVLVVTKYVRRRSVKGKLPAVSQKCKTDSSTLKPSSLASVKVIYWKIVIGQGVKAPPSPHILVLH